MTHRLEVRGGAGPEAPLSSRPRSGLWSAEPYRFEVRADGPLTVDDPEVRATLVELDLTIEAGQRLRYAVFAEFGGNDGDPRGGHGATSACVDLVLDDGSRSSAHGLVDHHGVPHTLLAQTTSKTLQADQWTAKEIDLSPLAGRRVVAAEVSVLPGASALDDRPAVGWVDGPVIETAPPTRASSPAEEVQTTRGTHASGGFSRGNNAPLTTVPHGFAFAVPVTDAGTNRWLYSWAADDVEPGISALQAFAVSHIASPWMADRSVVQLVMGDRTPTLDRAARARRFRHADETAYPHLYAVDFEDGSRAELTTTSSTLMLRLTWPEGTPSDGGTLLLDAVDDHGRLELATDEDGHGVISGYVDGPEARGEPQLRMFVWGRTDTVITETGRFDGQPRTGVAAWARPQLGENRQLVVTLATSFLSADQARHTADLEVGDAAFDVIMDRSKAQWDALLGRVRVEGATPDQRRTLYSNLYRLFSYPNDAAENTGTAELPHWRYASFLAPLAAEHTETATGAVIRDGLISANHGFWDTYRTAWPLLSLLAPERAAALADGFVQHYRDSGWTPRWSAPGYCDCMVGTSSDIVFADAAAAGADGFDLEGAFDSALRNATVPSPEPKVGRKGLDVGIFTGVTDTDTAEGLSWAMDNALNDYGVGRLAEMIMDRTPDHPRADELAAVISYCGGRAVAYANHFDPVIGFFQGVKPDGTFRQDPVTFDPRPWSEDYTETNAWGMRFTAPHDGEGLAALHGGRAELERRLDDFFAEPETAREEFKGQHRHVIHEMTEARNVRLGMLGLSNQPAHHIPYMYLYTETPDKTQAVLRECVDRLFLGSEIGQGYPGDEDNGEMSAWWVYAALGLYPLVPGSGRYVITAPRFDAMIIELDDGASLEVRAVRDTQAACFVRSVRVDGEPWTSTSIEIERLRRGALIEVELSEERQPWGSGPDDVPQSLTPVGTAPRPWRDRLAGVVAPEAPELTDDRGAAATSVDAGWSVEWTAVGTGPVELYTLTSTVDHPLTGWRLEGCRDDQEWQLVDERRDEGFRWVRQTRPFLLPDGPVDHDQYRLVAGTEGTLMQVELLGRD